MAQTVFLQSPLRIIQVCGIFLLVKTSSASLIAEDVHGVEIWAACWNLAMLDFGGPIGFPAFSRISRPFV